MRLGRRVALAAVVLLVAAGCGDDEDEPEAVEAEPTATSGDVALGETSLGEVLVDADGMTLYLFTPDAGGASTCTGGCAETWPPLTVDGEPAAGDGVDESLLGTVERDDGSTQVTYADHPLYTYAADGEPGDVTGQGVGGKWWVVGADGEAIEDEPAPATTGGGAGY